MATRDGTQMIQFRSGPLLGPLSARAHHGLSVDMIAKRDLERLYALIDRELGRLALSEPEALLVADACNGTLWEQSSIPLLWAEVDDALRGDGLAEKWDVDGGALVARLRGLSPLQSLALVDALERLWSEPNPAGERLRAVGLVRD